MKKFLSTLPFVLVLGTSAFSQNTKPVPTPTPPEEKDVVTISTNLIQIDVSVTDKNGKTVRDLRADEIEIYQNGKKQDISNFSFISNTREITEGQTAAKPQPDAIQLPPPPIKPEKVTRTIALVVDDLNLSFNSVYYVRRALKKFVDEQMQDGDLIAIIRTGAGIGALQQFTNDKRQLYAAIEKVTWNAAGNGKIGSFAPLEGKSEIERAMEEQTAEGQATVAEKQQAFNDFRSSVFATGTLGAVNYVVRGMAELPGRKSILLLSDGFRLFTQDPDSFEDSRRVLDAVRALVDRANRASVVIYTMDPRGLIGTSISAADNVMGMTSEEIQTAESDRLNEVIESQEGLKYLADETGGFAVVNNNDLSSGIRRVLDDQSYYLVGYMPDDDTFDAKTRHYNKLVVKVTRGGTKVRYRSGFFGVTDDAARNAVQKAQTKGADRMAYAITSPFAANEISLKLNTLFGNNSKDGSYVRSLLHIPAHGLSFIDQPDGAKKATFDILAVAFGDNGNAIDHISKSYSVTLKKGMYETILKSGFVYNFVFPMKKPGAYQLRVVLRDHKSDKVGSANQFIEVPNLKKKRLSLSGVALENIPFAAWQERNSRAGKSQANNDQSDPWADTSLRQFKQGTVLNYGLSIYNSKTSSGQPPNLTSQIKLFRDGKQIFEGKTLPVTPAGGADSKAINYTASLSLGTELPPGDYVLAIVITDNLAKEKQKTAIQFVQFEIVE